MDYTLEGLDWIELGESGWKRATVTLEEGDTAPNPASTKHVLYGPVLYGPALVTYDRYADGGIHIMVEDVPA